MKATVLRSATCAGSVALIGISSILVHPQQARADFDPSQYTFTTIDHPMATSHTIARGISGNTVVGFYYNGAGARGFMYDGSAFTDVNHPLGTTETVPCGVSGGVVAGYYRDGSNRVHGFTWDGSTYTTIDYPLTGAFDTTVLGIEGSKLAGYYYDSTGRTHGFLYDGSNYITLDHPDAIPGDNPSSAASAVSGSTVVGQYDTASGRFGYAYTGGVYTTLDVPQSTDNFTEAAGIDGVNIVGDYKSGGFRHGFVYDGTNYFTFDHPLSGGGVGNGAKTNLYGIDGTTIVGTYNDSAGITHGFIAVVPEPGAAAGLIALWPVLMRRSRRGERSNLYQLFLVQPACGVRIFRKEF